MSKPRDVAGVLKMMKDKDVKFVDLRFTDPRGKMQHLTMDVSQMDEDAWADGLMFDGSSIAGWKVINESDMVLMPDPASAHMDPFYAQATMAVFCDVLEPAQDARGILGMEVRGPPVGLERALRRIKEFRPTFLVVALGLDLHQLFLGCVPATPPPPLIGYLALYSDRELDVTAVYTAEVCSDWVFPPVTGGSFMCANNDTSWGAGLSIDVERVPGRLVVD